MKALDKMTVSELRQLARDLGGSSVTRLTRKAALIEAVEALQRQANTVDAKVRTCTSITTYRALNLPGSYVATCEHGFTALGTSEAEVRTAMQLRHAQPA